MFRHLLTSFYRQFKSNKTVHLLNFIVLSIGLLILLFIFFFLRAEFSFEDFHKNKNRIFRVLTVAQTGNSRDVSPFTPGPLGQALKDQFPQIEEFTNYEYEEWELVKTENYSCVIKKIACDASFFKIFSFELLKGDLASFVPGNGQTLFITESMGKKMFGGADPMDQTIYSTYGNTYIVRGIVKDPPKGSHIQFEAIAPIRATSPNFWMYAQNRNTYVMLKAGCRFSKDNLKDIQHFLKKHIENYPLIKFQPLKDIHYSNNLDDPWVSNKGDKNMVYLLISAAIALIFIMLFNFFNLSTSLHLARTKEFSIKKVLGLSSHKILREYIFNNALLILFSIVFSVLSFYILNNKWGTSLSFNMEGSNRPMLAIAFVFFLLMLAPIVAIHFLSKIKLSTSSLSSTSNFGIHPKHRIIGMTLQIAISVIIIVFAIVISRQMIYIKTKDLGLNYKNIVYLSTEGWRYSCETIRDILVKDPNIVSVSAGCDIPLNLTFKRRLVDWEGKNTEGFINCYVHFTDLGFFETFNIKLKEGGYFPDNFTLNGYFDRKNEPYCIINEAAAKQLGFKDPINKKLRWGGFDELSIIGVAEDFHYKPLQNTIEPLIITFNPEEWLFLFVRLKSINKPSLEYIKSTIEKFEEFGYPVEIKFLEDDLNNLYSTVSKMAYSTIIFAFTAILLSIIGLVALISFLEKKKQKAFAIKKVFGAQSRDVIKEFIIELSVYILPSMFISVYFAYLGANKWLESFAYKAPFPFILIAAILVLMYFLIIAIVYFKVRKSANTNPVEILKYE